MKFFLLTLLMGIDPKPRFFQFWSRKEYYHCTFYGATMFRDRFVQILRFLHVVDNRNQNSVTLQDLLWKVRPFVHTLSSRFKGFYYPGKELSLDEGTCPFKGRSTLRFYNTNKPNKWGMKLYQICDTVTEYCCSFNVATKKATTTHRLLLDLMDDFLGHDHLSCLQFISLLFIYFVIYLCLLIYLFLFWAHQSYLFLV